MTLLRGACHTLLSSALLRRLCWRKLLPHYPGDASHHTHTHTHTLSSIYFPVGKILCWNYHLTKSETMFSPETMLSHTLTRAHTHFCPRVLFWSRKDILMVWFYALPEPPEPRNRPAVQTAVCFQKLLLLLRLFPSPWWTVVAASMQEGRFSGKSNVKFYHFLDMRSSK